MHLDNDLENLESADPIYIIIYFCCCIIGLLSNLCIVFFTFRRNAKSVLQTYFLMYSITITFELLISIGLVTIYKYNMFHYLHSIILIELSLTLELVELLFILVMCLIWFFAIYNRTFKGHFKVVLMVIFVIVLLYYSTIVFGCVYEHLCSNAIDLDKWFYLIILFVTLLMYSMKFFLNARSNRTAHTNNFILIVITSYMLCWMPNTLLTIFYKFKLRPFNTTEYILAGCVGCLYSFFNLIVFILLYKNWRMRFLNLLECKSNTYTRTDENVADSVEDVSEVTTI